MTVMEMMVMILQMMEDHMTAEVTAMTVEGIVVMIRMTPL
ncbi:MAG: hypothetical protein Fur0044_47150 [Anaerolineae bacterium]